MSISAAVTETSSCTVSSTFRHLLLLQQLHNISKRDEVMIPFHFYTLQYDDGSFFSLQFLFNKNCTWNLCVSGCSSQKVYMYKTSSFYSCKVYTASQSDCSRIFFNTFHSWSCTMRTQTPFHSFEHLWKDGHCPTSVDVHVFHNVQK